MVFWMGTVTLAGMGLVAYNSAMQERLAAVLTLVMWVGFALVWLKYVFRGAL